MSLSRNVSFFFGSSVGSTVASTVASTFFFGADFFDLDLDMMNPHDDLENHNTSTIGLNEFMRAWIAYCAVVCLVPGVFVLCVCVAFGSLFALVISPFHAAVYMGAEMEGIRLLFKACSLGVLSDDEETQTLQHQESETFL